MSLFCGAKQEYREMRKIRIKDSVTKPVASKLSSRLSVRLGTSQFFILLKIPLLINAKKKIIDILIRITISNDNGKSHS